MNSRLFVAVLALSFPVVPQHDLRNQPQHQHHQAATPAAAEQAAHHACLDQERKALERGEGFGMAMVADRNGYPGPRHVLEWQSELRLSPGQQAAMKAIYDEMNRQAVTQGRHVLRAEEKLGEMFAQNQPEQELRAQSARIDSLHANLRWIHLRAHIAARKLLTPEQLTAYHQLRMRAH